MQPLRFVASLLIFATSALAQQSGPSQTAPTTPKAPEQQPATAEKAPPAAKVGPLGGIKTIQVDATVVSDPKKVKETWAANWIHDQLVAALQQTGFQIGESAVHANVVLDEFTSGSMAKRFMVGLGAGRSSITGNLVFADSAKQLASTRIHVRGGLLFSPYQGGNTQTRQAENSFEQKLVEEIERLK